MMNSFNEIYVLDLHGNSLKKEKCPDGSKDENVFDIRQGTAIALFIKEKNKKGNKVFHSERWGTRNVKYDWLNGNDIKTTKWKKLTPKSEFYLFIPRDERFLEQYESSPKVTDIFPVNSVGIVTARDKLTIQFTPEKVWTTILNFSKMDEELARLGYSLGKDVRDWKVKLAQKDLIDSGLDRNKITPILYRPFDIRYTYYTGKSRGFHCMPRPGVMRHMMQENLGLITARSNKSSQMNHFFCTKHLMETKCGESTTQSCLSPLYLYPDPDEYSLFSHQKISKEKQPNISPKVFSALSKAYKTDPTPEDIFFYIYAVLYSNTFRTKYSEFLKIDFPRVPFTKDHKLFRKLGEHGRSLADLHLLKSIDIDPPAAKFQGEGDKRVDKLKYDKNSLRVYINMEQYFEKIPKAIWEYQIGGYQVLSKWLKDRKGKILSLEDVKHYCKIVTAIKRTIDIQNNIDALYPKAEKETIKL